MPDTGANRPLVTVSHAAKVYDTGSGAVHALQDLSLTIDRGEFVCILGPSGCGKSTLLWAMSGLHPLTSGTIAIDGLPVTGAISAEDICRNDFIAGVNDFDVEAVKEDARTYALDETFAALEMPEGAGFTKEELG